MSTLRFNFLILCHSLRMMVEKRVYMKECVYVYECVRVCLSERIKLIRRQMSLSRCCKP